MWSQKLSVVMMGVCLVVQGPGGVAPVHAQAGPNSCIYANDGECDDPTVPGHMYSVCAPGTDTNDCNNPAGLIGGGGGTASVDPSSGLYTPCPYTNDGDCDEPHGLNLCAPGTDTVDCANPNANFGSGSGYGTAGVAGAAGASPDTYAPWTRITNDQRHYATQSGGVLGLLVSNGMAFEVGSYTIFHGLTDGSGPTSPIWDIRTENVTLSPGARYIARASGAGLVSFQLGGGALIMYPTPQPGFAMIYARNDDVAHWRAMCVLPSGWPISYCGP